MDRDAMVPLPPGPGMPGMPGLPGMPGPPAWATQYTNPYGPSYLPPPPPPPQNYVPPAPYNFVNDTASYVSMPVNCADSIHSGSGKADGERVGSLLGFRALVP